MNTIPHASPSARARARRRGFTLVELLVVLAIIGILAALLFPAFRGAQENGRQASCQSNLKSIWTAVQQYRQDEGKYPANLAVLLPNTEKLDNTETASPGVTPAPGTTVDNKRGTGYLKSTSSLVCPGDDTNNGKLRSSYSNVSTFPAPTIATPPATADLGRYAWNYWGYNAEGYALGQQDDAAYFGAAGDTTTITGHPGGRYLRDPSRAFDASTNPVDPLKVPRLANRQAPADTIIAHCVYHRMPTSDLAKPTDIYTETAYAAGASDIVLRLDGSTEKADVTLWKGEKWIKQIR